MDKNMCVSAKIDISEPYSDILTEKTAGMLPKDAYLKVDGQKYYRNRKGNFVIPLGTIETSATRSIQLCSDMFGTEQKDYEFTGDLYLAASKKSEAPLNGAKVQTANFKFSKSGQSQYAFSVTGDRIGTRAEWKDGKSIQIRTDKIPENGNVTVTAYEGIQGNQKATSLLSSVSGIFTLENGSGTLDKSAAQTNKLVLNSSAATGTYRLEFVVTDKDGTQVLKVPYYFIVQE